MSPVCEWLQVWGNCGRPTPSCEKHYLTQVSCQLGGGYWQSLYLPQVLDGCFSRSLLPWMSFQWQLWKPLQHDDLSVWRKCCTDTLKGWSPTSAVWQPPEWEWHCVDPRVRDLWSVISENLWPYKYMWNLLIPKIKAKASFSSCEYLHSLGERVLDAKAMGCSLPSWHCCEIAAPTPKAKASASIDNGRDGS